MAELAGAATQNRFSYLEKSRVQMRERIEQQAKEFSHRTAIVDVENGSDDKGKGIN
jgi:hypothetical protein